MTRWLRSIVTSSLVVLLALQVGCAANKSHAAGKSYVNHPDAKAFVDDMVAAGFERAYIETVLAKARRQESILKAMSRPAERRLDWGGYSKIFLDQPRISQGVKFWQQYQPELERAEAEYGVPAEIIIAIIGVETRYGRIMGSYRVLDSLATLGFDYPRRAKFFRSQLKDYLFLLREEGIQDYTALKGSYAGAMGFGQFMPSSYRNFAVDFSGDGKRRLITDKVDAIGSVANYFKQHGWQTGEPVRLAAALPDAALDKLANKKLKPETTVAQWQGKGIVVADQAGAVADDKASLMRLSRGKNHEYWLALNNFYVITRYNRSRLYASAVYELSQQIKAAYEKRNG